MKIVPWICWKMIKLFSSINKSWSLCCRHNRQNSFYERWTIYHMWFLGYLNQFLVLGCSSLQSALKSLDIPWKCHQIIHHIQASLTDIQLQSPMIQAPSLWKPTHKSTTHVDNDKYIEILPNSTPEMRFSWSYNRQITPCSVNKHKGSHVFTQNVPQVLESMQIIFKTTNCGFYFKLKNRFKTAFSSGWFQTKNSSTGAIIFCDLPRNQCN